MARSTSSWSGRKTRLEARQALAIFGSRHRACFATEEKHRGCQGSAHGPGDSRVTKRRWRAHQVVPESSGFGGRTTDLWRAIPPRPIDNLEGKKRGKREEGLGYL
jgi:hypothetical protein